MNNINDINNNLRRQKGDSMKCFRSILYDLYYKACRKTEPANISKVWHIWRHLLDWLITITEKD